jgi:hypothetical protein
MRGLESPPGPDRPLPQIEPVVPQGLVVGAHVDGDRQQVPGADPAAGGVHYAFPYRNAARGGLRNWAKCSHVGTAWFAGVGQGFLHVICEAGLSVLMKARGGLRRWVHMLM